MQSIRLLWPRPRTWPSKCIEAFRALELEEDCDKEGILQLYLNLAPYGGNVIGVEAAARHYFAKPARELTLGEAALLAGIPQSPARFNPQKHLGAALHRRKYVLVRMRTLGLASAGDIEAALREPIRLAGKPVRTEAPRFADFIIQRLRQTGGMHRMTLCPRTQAIARTTVEKHAQKFREMGIDGMAIVIVDVKDASLAAMVGNVDPRNPLTGCINAATAKRQPGSLLKPFIYCAAYGKGMLTPQAVVYDVPTAWRGYRPENMDREFLGPISAAEALSFSRNIPAVRLLDALGTGQLTSDMNKMKLTFQGATDKYGLSLALGTAELRLVDIANAYAALARLGEFRPLRILADEPESASRKVYSPGAAWLTLRSLGAAESGKTLKPVWKTGTSWNHRDAWAVSLTPKYIIAVWCGRLSGQGHPALVGADTALPIALEITGQLASDENRSWVRPTGVRIRKVCALSGAPATFACAHTTEGEYLVGISSESPCRIHRFACRNGKRKIVTHLPQGITRSVSTPQGTKTHSAKYKARVTILSPLAGGEYILADDDAIASTRLAFAAQTDSAETTVYWFLDGNLLGPAPAAKSFSWRMKPGEHELIAADSRGASARIQFRVSRLSNKGK